MKAFDHIPPETWDRIEAYCLKQMSPQQRQQFENELADNPQLQQQADELKLLIEGIETYALREKMNEFHQSLHPPKPSATRSLRPWMYSAVAAVAAVLILWLLVDFSNTSEKIYARHFVPDPGLPTTMSTTENFKFFEGMVDYKQKNYQTALNKWLPLLDQKPTNDTLQYFVGVTYLALGETEKALPYIDQALQNKPSIFNQDALYYKALVLVKHGDFDAAQQLLQQSDTERNLRLLEAINNR